MDPWSDERIRTAFNDELERLQYSPNPEDRRRASEELERRRTPEPRQSPDIQPPSGVVPLAEPALSQGFDPRKEVSADARYIARRIVTHLWIIFVLLPFILRLLWQVLR